MIRTSYPVPPMQQLRLRMEMVGRRTCRTLEQRRRALRDAAAERERAMGATAVAAPRMLRGLEDAARLRASYEAFYDAYDVHIGLLCVAAQEGVTPAHESRYRESRAWFAANYPKLKDLIAPFLPADDSDTTPAPLWGHRACDAFEALYLPTSLAAMFEADNGNLIGRLMRTQNALAAWESTFRS